MSEKDEVVVSDLVKKRVQEERARQQDSRLMALDVMRDTYVIDNALMQREVRRLRRKLGENHPRVKKLEAGIARTSEVVRELQVRREITKISVPDTPDSGVLVHGRVVDEQYRGCKGLVVFGQDENFKPVRALGTATTDSSGYYAIPLDAELLKQLGTVKIYVAVKTKSDRILHRQDKPLRQAPNSRELVEIVLERNRLWPTTAAAKTSKKKLPMVKAEELSVTGHRRVNDTQTAQRTNHSNPAPTQEPKHGENKMQTQRAIETAERIMEDREGADYYNDAAILAPYLQKTLNVLEQDALELARNINEDRKGADYYKDVKVLADYFSSYIDKAEREQESAAVPGWLELYDLSIHRDVEAVAPTGFHVLGLINEDGVFEPTSEVVGEALYPPPDSTVPGWVELKTLATHRDMEAVAPVEPYVHGVLDNEGHFYPDEPPVISRSAEI